MFLGKLKHYKLNVKDLFAQKRIMIYFLQIKMKILLLFSMWISLWHLCAFLDRRRKGVFCVSLLLWLLSSSSKKSLFCFVSFLLISLWSLLWNFEKKTRFVKFTLKFREEELKNSLCSWILCTSCAFSWECGWFLFLWHLCEIYSEISRSRIEMFWLLQSNENPPLIFSE